MHAYSNLTVICKSMMHIYNIKTVLLTKIGSYYANDFKKGLGFTEKVIFYSMMLRVIHSVLVATSIKPNDPKTDVLDNRQHQFN